MKDMLILLCIHLVLVGCNGMESTGKYNPHLMVQKEKQEKNKISEVIVVFNKGVTIQDAQKMISSYGMQVLKVYTSISKSTQKPMLHISSPLPMEEMIQQLRRSSSITSISPNYKRELN